MAIQNRRGNIADFDPFKMLPGEFGYVLDTEELYYCVAPGNVKRVATKEDIVQILDTNQEAYNGLQQLLTELENETVVSGILNDISDLLVETAQHDSKIDSLENRTTINETNITGNTTNIAENRTDIDTNAQDIINLDTKTMSHLAENASQINELETIKADRTYVDTQITSVASGNPKDVYATLVALQTAYPTGAEGIYLVTEDGKWYYWTSGVWTSGGTYQSTGISDGSVTEEKLSFIPVKGVQSKNLFDKATVIVDYYLYTDNGEIGPLADYNTSTYIAVLPNTDYTLTKINRICYYNSDKIYISGHVVSDATIKTPVNTAFIRVTVLAHANNLAQVEIGNIATPYEPFGSVLAPSSMTTKMKNQLENIDAVYPVQGINLFNKATAIVDTYLYTDTGGIAPNPDYTTSDYIRVSPSTVYSTLLVKHVCFYNANKQFISSGTDSPKSITTPSNCAYIRFYAFSGSINQIQIQVGTATAYEPYGMYINKNIFPKGYKKSLNNVIVVSKNNGDYSTIMDAVNRANDDINNPSTIRIAPGIYLESVDLRGGRHISLIGENKRTCIIKNESGNYYTPPLNIGGNAYIANLTVIANHANPTIQNGLAFGHKDYLPSYGIHMDDLGEGINEINNCIVISNHNSAIGMGLHNNQENIINNCELYKQDTNSVYKELYSYIGALIAHNKQKSGAINQKLTVKNSKINSDYGNALRLVDANHDVGGDANDLKDTVFSFYNNIIFSDALKKDCLSLEPTPNVGYLAGYIKLGEDSFGNNVPELNA